MKTFHTGIDTQLTSKVNDNAELLDRSIRTLGAVNTDIISDVNALAIANSESEMTTNPSNFKAYSNLTPPNVDSVTQINSIFDMYHDGTLAEVTRVHDIFDKSNSLYTTHYSGVALPSSMLQTSVITKHSESAGIDTSRSTKWNANFIDGKSALDGTSKNIMEVSKQVVSMKSDELSSTNVSMYSGVGGVLTSDLDTHNWSDLLPDFVSLYMFEHKPGFDSRRIAYKDINGLCRIGLFNVRTLTYTHQHSIASSAFEFDITAYGQSKYPSDFWNSFHLRRYIWYDESTQKTFIMTLVEITRLLSSQQRPYFWRRGMVFDEENVLLSDTDSMFRGPVISFDYEMTLIDPKFITETTGGMTYIVFQFRYRGYSGDREYMYLLLTQFSINHSTNAYSESTLTDNQATGWGWYTDWQMVRYGTKVGTVSYVRDISASAGTSNKFTVTSRLIDLTTNTLTTQVNWTSTSTSSWNNWQYAVYTHGNVYGVRFAGWYSGSNLRQAQCHLWCGDTKVTEFTYSSSSTQPVTAASFRMHPSGVESDMTVGNTVLKRVAKFDETFEDYTVGSNAGITQISDYLSDEGVYQPITHSSTTLTRLYNSMYTVSHTIAHPYTQGDLLYTTNKPHIHAFLRDVYDENETIINTAHNKDGWDYATNTDTSMQVKYTLHGYPLANFTADNVFVIKED